MEQKQKNNATPFKSVAMKSQSDYQKILILVSLSIGVFILSLGILELTPRIVEMAEAKTQFLGNQVLPQTSVLGSEKSAPSTTLTQIINHNLNPPAFSSKEVLAQDFETGKVLYEKNMNQRVAPASTTKIMTALVAQEYFRPADILTVPQEAMVGGSTMGLKVGEQLTFRSLLYGMLLNSGNDAAYTIAINYPGGYSAFIDRMNQKALSLGLKDTHFVNPAGFDNPNHYSSAYDLSLIAKQSALNPQLARIVSTEQTQILSWDKSHIHNLKNLNKLLSEQGVIGIKTGTTEQAGENLVGLVERDGHKVLTVVLGSVNRFGETKSLIDWVYSNYSWNSGLASTH